MQRMGAMYGRWEEDREQGGGVQERRQQPPEEETGKTKEKENTKDNGASPFRINNAGNRGKASTKVRSEEV